MAGPCRPCTAARLRARNGAIFSAARTAKRRACSFAGLSRSSSPLRTSGASSRAARGPFCSPARPIYRALGIPDVRHRRSKAASTIVLMRRLLSLDYLIERPTFGWLPTEADKVQRFEALGLDRRTFPYRLYGPDGKPQTPRYFAFKLPIAVDDQAVTFVYVDAGQTTDSELRAWGVAHAPLWAALRARTFAVHVVAVGTGVEAENRAAPLLKYWTQDGDGTGATNPTGQTQADPEIRQEIARLKEATSGGNRSLLGGWGGYKKAVERLMELRQLPEGTPTKTKARGAIDRFQIWSTVRLTGPEVAI